MKKYSENEALIVHRSVANKLDCYTSIVLFNTESESYVKIQIVPLIVSDILRTHYKWINDWIAVNITEDLRVYNIKVQPVFR